MLGREQQAWLEDELTTASASHELIVCTNTDYSSSGDGGFPLLHVAALDRPGSMKGGPYSEGAVPGGGHFATLEMIDNGTEAPQVVLTAHDWDGSILLQHNFSVPATP